MSGEGGQVADDASAGTGGEADASADWRPIRFVGRCAAQWACGVFGIAGSEC